MRLFPWLPIAGRRAVQLACVSLIGLVTALFFTQVWPAAGERPAISNTVFVPFLIKQETRAVCGQPVVVSGNIDSHVTWSSNSLYVVDRDIVIQPGGSLTILPGTVVKFKPGRGITVEGRLTSDGNSAHPVFLTSWNDDTLCGDSNSDGTATTARAGDWRWIEFKSGSDPASSMRYVVVRYGGRSGGNWRAPIRAFNVSPTFDRLSITNSHRNAVQLVGGEWTTQALRSTTVIYWVYEAGHITVLPGNLLEVNPGVKIKFGDGHGLYVLGQLTAEGTTANPIHFTSDKDDSLCGLGTSGEPVCDTNDDLTASTPAAGNWKWIHFTQESDLGSAITDAIFRYGGRNGNDWRAPIRIHNITPTFERLTIEHSHRNAVQLIGGNWTSQTLRSQTVVYWVHDNHFAVLAANTLTILPGVKIKWSEGHAMGVHGRLEADGTLQNPIVMTSERDDTVCGAGVNGEPICDTNDDAAATVPESGNWGWIHFHPGSDPTSSLTYADIRYGGRLGYDWRAPVIIQNVSPTLEHLTFTENHRNAVWLHGGNWTTNTLASQTVIYWVYDNHLVVLAANTLTILPGVRIKWHDSHAMGVLGKLEADGTPQNPIVMTSERDDTVCGAGVNGEPICDTNNDVAATVPESGNWGWIHFHPGSDPTSSLTYADIRYGGRLGYDWRAPLVIENVTPTLEYLTLSNSHRNAVWLHGGNWTTNTLASQTVVYWVFDNHLTVLASNMLTILPGVKIKWSDSHGLGVFGKLVADGTPQNPIVMTSERDDTVCGEGVNGEPICDTNNNGADNVPAWGDWGWIHFHNNSDPSSSMSNAVFRYGGRMGYDWRGVILINTASPTISNVLFDTNHGPIYFYDNAAPTLGCNDMVGNKYGHWNHNPANLVKAEGQWWGSGDGPTHAGNPGGSGQPTSDGIDYQPWATSPCTDFGR